MEIKNGYRILNRYPSWDCYYLTKDIDGMFNKIIASYSIKKKYLNIRNAKEHLPNKDILEQFIKLAETGEKFF